jgi:single-strand DNA-binding protein
MSADINQVVLVGRLTRDAEIRYTSGGMANSRFSLAVNRRTKKENEWVDEVSFFDIIIWGKTAEGLTKYLLKGTQVAVAGELRQDRWEKDGQKQSRIVINAHTVQLLGGKKETAPPALNESLVNDPSFFDDDIPF